MIRRPLFVLLVASCMFLLFGCSTAETGSVDIDYEETKKMVVDILKTEEGKKALTEVLWERLESRRMN